MYNLRLEKIFFNICYLVSIRFTDQGGLLSNSVCTELKRNEINQKSAISAPKKGEEVMRTLYYTLHLHTNVICALPLSTVTWYR